MKVTPKADQLRATRTSEDLLAERDRLVAEKSKLVAELTDINEECRDTLPHATFRRLAARRAEIVREMAASDGRLADIRSMLRKAPKAEPTRRPVDDDRRIRGLLYGIAREAESALLAGEEVDEDAADRVEDLIRKLDAAVPDWRDA